MTLNEYLVRHRLIDIIPICEVEEIIAVYEDADGNIDNINEDDIAELIASFGYAEEDDYSPTYDETEEDNF